MKDALLKSNKVDNELDEIENWIAYKEHEILDDEGIIITEEQFDQRTIKYKVTNNDFYFISLKIENFFIISNN